MSYRKINIWDNLDWWTIALYLTMVVAGWFSIYAASYDYDRTGMLDWSGRSGKQMVWILTSLALGFLIVMIESDWYEIFAFWIYFLIMALLLLTVFVATDIKGSRSWLVFGPVSLQPAEFAKFATALAMAKAMSAYRFNLLEWRNFARILGIIFLPMMLILLQKETGSALVFLAFFLVLYREGMSGFIIFSGFCAVLYFVLSVRFGHVFWMNETPLGEYLILLFIIAVTLFLLYNDKKGRSRHSKYVLAGALGVLIISLIIAGYVHTYKLTWIALALIAALAVYAFFLFIKYLSKRYIVIMLFSFCSLGFLYSVDYVFNEILEPHQKIRIEVALGVIDDPGGAGYNVNQSKIAIGSGGLLGKGYLNGTQTKLKYVPEQDTDFIFCTIGEEKGFIGSFVVLALFFTLIIRIIFLAERQRSVFYRIYGYSVAAIIFFHLFINIGMVTGITPVIGIPLPLFSYGGSSLWSFTILLFIFLRLDASRNARL
ncbi:MAG: rod shape-determining protein RodA [Dysgonamonadaceae bacterium]|jgi:rod shape determining protein RodA|nr:rod shape-determining protein RodA [Dysgonamonadaceae bacterium]